MLERRSHVRMPSYLGGRLHLRHLNAGYDVVIRNMTQGGCRIVLPSPILVPASFDLEVTTRGQMFRARVVWRDQLVIGVAFEARNTESVEPIQLDQVRRLRRLEQENKNLQRRVEDLSSPA